MATICVKIFKHHLKADGSYNVKIRIFHKNENSTSIGEYGGLDHLIPKCRTGDSDTH